ncbi:MAG: hypothetical protein HY657_02005 [Acidobacteria bacterium]|nr:hypothetical protein [Acidobacteriota bacterium]
MTRIVVLIAVLGVAFVLLTSGATAQSPGPLGPRVELRPVTPLRLTGEVDSNSPALWERIGGRNLLFVMTSIAGLPSTASGSAMDRLGPSRPVTVDPWPGGGVWMEALVKDVDGAWYGYYHQEMPAQMCGSSRVIPRIGAARSRDAGRTWEPLGTVLAAPPRTYDCTSHNEYFVGGVGDFSVQLDPTARDLYFFFSLYLRSSRQQGVSVARLAWADRDAPVGRIMVWRGRSWVPAAALNLDEEIRFWIYPPAVPIFPTTQAWHDDDQLVDAFWGPSVHWNTHLEQYVMLLNRASNENFAQEGIYVSYAPRLDDPRLWSEPVKILHGGRWYPQVIGLEPGTGTDKVAGEWARFFMSGLSQHLIHFIR